MAKVYVVTKGDYSDYRIVAIFSDREVAATVAAAHTTTYDEVRVEEFELDIINPEIGFDYMFSSYDKPIMGKDSQVRVCTEFDDKEMNKVNRHVWNHSNSISYHVKVRAKTPEHAIKIGSDLIAQFKASETK